MLEIKMRLGIIRLHTELDAYNAHLYGLTRDEMRYAARLSASIRKRFTGRTRRHAHWNLQNLPL